MHKKCTFKVFCVFYRLIIFQIIESAGKFKLKHILLYIETIERYIDDKVSQSTAETRVGRIGLDMDVV